MMKKFYYVLAAALCAWTEAAADDWMGRLPDNMYVSQVSIPGSHDTATGNGFSESGSLLGPGFAQTQDTNMGEQWAQGVRAFDLRPCTREGYLHINHGVVETSLRFDDALRLLRDSLAAHPTEFAVVHLLHATDGDKVEGAYEELLLTLLQNEEFKNLFADFRKNLTVGDMRGKVLLLSRDKYANKPIGGFMSNWCGYINWNAQRNGSITGPNAGTNNTATLYMQDFSDTRKEGAIDQKVSAINKLLDFTTTHKTTKDSEVVWAFNFASAYSKGSFASTSEGYRENASYTNVAIIDYLNSHEAGPTGIVMIDYIGVDESKTYATRGKELTQKIIDNNFNFLDRRNKEIYDAAMVKINALYDTWNDVEKLIATECADVAENYNEIMAESKAEIDSLKAEHDSLYAGRLFQDGYTVKTAIMLFNIKKIGTQAQKAQAEYEQAVGINTVINKEAAKIACVFTMDGREISSPHKGGIYIVKFVDGSTRKVRF